MTSVRIVEADEHHRRALHNTADNFAAEIDKAIETLRDSAAALRCHGNVTKYGERVSVVIAGLTRQVQLLEIMWHRSVVVEQLVEEPK